MVENPRARVVGNALKLGIGFAFVIEYIARLVMAYCWEGRKGLFAYMFSFNGCIDVVAGLSVIEDFDFSVRPRRHFNWFWTLRMFRVIKCMRYLKEMNVIARAVSAQAKAMVIFMVYVFLFCFMFGTVLFYIESDEDGFDSIPASMWHVIISITTVGYGDMVPQTTWGRILIGFVVLLGYAVLAVPTIVGVMCVFFTEQGARHSQAPCPDRVLSDHLHALASQLSKPVAPAGAHLVRLPMRPWDVDAYGNLHLAACHQLCEAAVLEFYATKASWRPSHDELVRPIVTQSALNLSQPSRAASASGEVMVVLSAASISEGSCVYHLGLCSEEAGPVFARGLIEHSWVHTTTEVDDEQHPKMPPAIALALERILVRQGNGEA